MTAAREPFIAYLLRGQESTLALDKNSNISVLDPTGLPSYPAVVAAGEFLIAGTSEHTELLYSAASGTKAATPFPVITAALGHKHHRYRDGAWEDITADEPDSCRTARLSACVSAQEAIIYRTGVNGKRRPEIPGLGGELKHFLLTPGHVIIGSTYGSQRTVDVSMPCRSAAEIAAYLAKTDACCARCSTAAGVVVRKKDSLDSAIING